MEWFEMELSKVIQLQRLNNNILVKTSKTFCME